MSAVSAAGRLRQLADEGTGTSYSLPWTVVWFWGPKENRRVEKEKLEADARLIAVAPDLARLLADCVEWAEDVLYDSPLGGCLSCGAHFSNPHEDDCAASSLLARAAVLAGGEQNDE